MTLKDRAQPPMGYYPSPSPWPVDAGSIAGQKPLVEAFMLGTDSAKAQP
jgi:hypothetical protein